MQREHNEGLTGLHFRRSQVPLKRLFFEANAQLMDHLASAAARDDVQTALRLAHAIKGAALFVGFSALADAASEAEVHLRRSHIGAATSAIARARQLLCAGGP